jgi:hypothetical protein
MSATGLSHPNGAISDLNHWATVTHHNKLSAFGLLANGFD